MVAARKDAHVAADVSKLHSSALHCALVLETVRCCQLPLDIHKMDSANLMLITIVVVN